MIQVRGLVKAYGGRKVLRGVDLDVAQGECLVLMGPNGAGKTTLLRVLVGLVKPGGGAAHIAGSDVAQDAMSVRHLVGFVSHQLLLYEDLSALENLAFYGRLYGVPHLDTRMATLLSQVGLWARRDDPVRIFSRGMRQRLSIARALLHDPPVLLLDEPYTGLDQAASQVLDGLLALASAGAQTETSGTPRTVLLTTHNLEHAFRARTEHGPSTSAAILANGRLVYQMAGVSQDDAAHAEAVARFREEYDRWMAVDPGTARRPKAA